MKTIKSEWLHMAKPKQLNSLQMSKGTLIIEHRKGLNCSLSSHHKQER